MTINTEKAWSRALVVLTLGAAGLALSGCSLLGNAGTGTDTPTAEGDNTDVFTIKVGDCLNDGAVEGEISTVPTVDCAEPHDSEAYASIMMEDGDFPGDDAVRVRAETDCTAEFNAFVGVDYEASSLSFSYFYPTESSWADGDREILCLALDPAGQVTGSLKDAAR